MDKPAERYLTKTLHVLEDVMLGVMANRVQKYLINTETCFMSGKVLHFRSSASRRVPINTKTYFMSRKTFCLRPPWIRESRTNTKK